MSTITLDSLLDDLRTADETLREFEQRYWLGSEEFYGLYSEGLLDNGENMEDYAEWAGFYKIRQHRQSVLRLFSKQRAEQLRRDVDDGSVQIRPLDPMEGDAGIQAALVLKSELDRAAATLRTVDTTANMEFEAAKAAREATKAAREALIKAEASLDTAASAVRKAAEGYARSYGETSEDLVAAYRRMDSAALKREIAEVTSAMSDAQLSQHEAGR